MTTVRSDSCKSFAENLQTAYAEIADTTGLMLADVECDTLRSRYFSDFEIIPAVEPVSTKMIAVEIKYKCRSDHIAKRITDFNTPAKTGAAAATCGEQI